jgi:hypothetical protein
MAMQAYNPQKLNIVSASASNTNLVETLKAGVSSGAQEIEVKTQMLVQHTKILTQHCMQRSRTTVKAVSNAGGLAYLNYVKFKIFYQHLSSYPKVIYAPLLFFACGVYGYHSVKKT